LARFVPQGQATFAVALSYVTGQSCNELIEGFQTALATLPPTAENSSSWPRPDSAGRARHDLKKRGNGLIFRFVIPKQEIRCGG
jgi:hypothetical protein